jgi:hypothetical protein
VVADPEIHRMETELAGVLRTAHKPSPHTVVDLGSLTRCRGWRTESRTEGRRQERAQFFDFLE